MPFDKILKRTQLYVTFRLKEKLIYIIQDISDADTLQRSHLGFTVKIEWKKSMTIYYSARNSFIMVLWNAPQEK